MKVTVVGSGFVGQTTAMRILEKGLAEVCLIDIIEGKPQGLALDIRQAAPVEGYEPSIVGHERLRGHGRLGHRRHHRRVPSPAGDEPDGPPREERRDHARRGRAGGAGLAGRDPHRGLEPARRDDLPGGRGLRLPEGAGHGHGRGAGLGPAAVLHRGGAVGLAERGRGDHARLARGLDGGAAASRDRERHAPAGAGRRGHPGPALPADAGRRGRDRGAAEDGVGLLRAERLGGGDGRGDRARTRRTCCRSAPGPRASTASATSTWASRRASARKESRRSSSST